MNENEWRSVDTDKWRNQVKTVSDVVRIDYLEEWEKDGQIAYEFEKMSAAKDAEIEKWRKENEVMTGLVTEMDAEIDMLRKALGTAGYTINQQTAEIERLRARNEFLEKVVEQAVSIGEVDFEPEGNIHSTTLQTECSCEMPIENYPELAAWLKEKENANP